MRLLKASEQYIATFTNTKVNCTKVTTNHCILLAWSNLLVCCANQTDRYPKQRSEGQLSLLTGFSNDRSQRKVAIPRLQWLFFAFHHQGKAQGSLRDSQLDAIEQDAALLAVAQIGGDPHFYPLRWFDLTQPPLTPRQLAARYWVARLHTNHLALTVPLLYSI